MRTRACRARVARGRVADAAAGRPAAHAGVRSVINVRSAISVCGGIVRPVIHGPDNVMPSMSTPSPPAPQRRSVTVRLRPDLIARARELARDLAGKPHYLTFVGLIENALSREIARIEREVDGGASPPSATRQGLPEGHLNHHHPVHR